MPSVPQITIADYKLLQSRHFFPNGYLITNDVSFNESFDSGLKKTLKLSGGMGVNIAEMDPEAITYNALDMPIILTRGNHNDSRVWVDGLDFLMYLLGQNCEDIDTDNKIFRYNDFDYDASVIQSIKITANGLNPIKVVITFDSNVENVFVFPYDQFIFDFTNNENFPEMRAASSYDIKVGIQTQEKQITWSILESMDLTIDFKIDSFNLVGTGISRKTYLFTNYDVEGSFKIVDDLNAYDNILRLYPINNQNYNSATFEQQDTSSTIGFAFDMTRILPTAFFRFSTDIANVKANRSVENGILQTTVNFFAFNRNF